MNRLIVILLLSLATLSGCATLPSSSLRSERRWSQVPSGVLSLVVELKRRGVRTVAVSGYGATAQRLGTYLKTQDLRVCRHQCPRGVRPEARVHVRPVFSSNRQPVTLWTTDSGQPPIVYTLDPDHLLVL